MARKRGEEGLEMYWAAGVIFAIIVCGIVMYAVWRLIKSLED